MHFVGVKSKRHFVGAKSKRSNVSFWKMLNRLIIEKDISSKSSKLLHTLLGLKVVLCYLMGLDFGYAFERVSLL